MCGWEGSEGHAWGLPGRSLLRLAGLLPILAFLDASQMSHGDSSFQDTIQEIPDKDIVGSGLYLQVLNMHKDA